MFLSPGSVSGKNIPLQSMPLPLPLPPPHASAYSLPPPSVHGNHTPASNNQMLDYLENQVKGMDMTSPMVPLQVCNHLACPICFCKLKSIQVLCHIVIPNYSLSLCLLSAFNMYSEANNTVLLTAVVWWLGSHQ